MKQLKKVKIGKIVFALTGFLENLSENSLLNLLNFDKYSSVGVLGGRSYFGIIEVQGFGKAIVKQYKRGGLFAKFISNLYLRLGKSRPEKEFDLLVKLSELPINFPKPLGYAYTTDLFYKAWLFSELIEDCKSLAEISLADPDRADMLLVELVRQISVLINNSICHVDLHPGNVLITKDDKLFLIDFDKAYVFSGTKSELRDIYIHRWRRAVIKHDLPESLTEIACMGLRKNYELGQ